MNFTKKFVLINFIFFSFVSRISLAAEVDQVVSAGCRLSSILEKLSSAKNKVVSFAKNPKTLKVLKASPYIFCGFGAGIAGWKLRKHLPKMLVGVGIGSVGYMVMAGINCSYLCKIMRGLKGLCLFSDKELRSFRVATWCPGKDVLVSSSGASGGRLKVFYSPAEIIASKDKVENQLKSDLISGKIVEIPVVTAGQEDLVEKMLWISANEQANKEEEILCRKMKEVSSLTNADEILEQFEDIDVSQCDDDVLAQMSRLIESNCKSSGFKKVTSIWLSEKDKLDLRLFGLNYEKASRIYYELFKRRFYLKALQVCIAEKLSDSLGDKKLISLIER